MLARGAAAEILPGNEDLGILVFRLVQNEIGQGSALVVITDIVKRADAQPRAPDGFQELLRDDDVGIDIDHLQRRGGGLQCRKWLHFISSLIVCEAARFVLVAVSGSAQQFQDRVLALQLTLFAVPSTNHIWPFAFFAACVTREQ